MLYSSINILQKILNTLCNENGLLDTRNYYCETKYLNFTNDELHEINNLEYYSIDSVHKKNKNDNIYILMTNNTCKNKSFYDYINSLNLDSNTNLLIISNKQYH